MELESIVLKYCSLYAKQAEVDGFVEKIKQHWLTAETWKSLTEEKKMQTGLPAILVNLIDQELEGKTKTTQGIPIKEYNLTILSRNFKYLTFILCDYQWKLQMKAVAVSSITNIVCTLFGLASKDAKVEFIKKHGNTIAQSVYPSQQIAVHSPKHSDVSVVLHVEMANFSCMDSWLCSHGLDHLVHTFFMNELVDFLVVPFVNEQILISLGLEAVDLAYLMKEINRLTNMDSTNFFIEWLETGGLNVTNEIKTLQLDLGKLLTSEGKETIENFVEHHTDLDTKNFARMIRLYQDYSSVYETHRWLTSHGFSDYAFHFARFNIPFYALPFVNFFIVGEMGMIGRNHRELLLELRKLKKAPAFSAIAVASWLRDAEAERFNLVAARSGIKSLDDFLDYDMAKLKELVDDEREWGNIEHGILEMKEFQIYYYSTKQLLENAGLGKYAEIFMDYALSIDILPLVSEIDLIEMGINNAKDRSSILTMIQRFSQDAITAVASDQHLQTLITDPDVNGFSKSPRNRKNSENTRTSNKKLPQSMSPNSGGNAKKKLSKDEELQKRKEDEKNVEEWLSYITEGSKNINMSNSEYKKKQRKIQQKKKKKALKKRKASISEVSKTSSSNASIDEEPLNCDEDELIDSNSLQSLLEEISKTLEPKEIKDVECEFEEALSKPDRLRAPNKMFMEPFPIMFDEPLEGSDEELDPQLKELLDKEVEEFRRRLEFHSISKPLKE